MACYNCKVRIVNEREIRVYAKNKNEAAEIAANECTRGFGINISNEAECVEAVRERRADNGRE